MISNEALLAIIGILSVLAGAWAYGYRNEQNRRTLVMQREIDKAKEDAQETQTLLGIMQKMLQRMESADTSASEERRVWTKVVEQNAEAKVRLAESVDKNTEAVVGVTQEVKQNTGAVTTHGTKVDEMQAQFVAFEKVVSTQFDTFKQQLEDGLSEEKLGPILDVVFERFIKRIQGVIVHAPQIAAADDDDTLQLRLDSRLDIPIPTKPEGESVAKDVSE